MTIRCLGCHGTVTIQPAQFENPSVPIACGKCGHTYHLKTSFGLEEARRSLSNRARHIARDSGIDLPGAYSVALELMTVEQVRELGNATSPSCHTATAAKEDHARARFNFDRDFAPAIQAGFLTPRQASERGKRDAYAGLLIGRHGFTSDVAYDVTDNRISLLEAIRQRQKQGHDSAAVDLGKQAQLRRTWLVAALALVALAAAVWLVPAWPSGTGKATTKSYAGAEVLIDHRGRIVQAIGPSPWGVLRAYCAAADGGGRLAPITVVPSSKPGSPGRLGLFRDPARPDEVLAISIQEDRRTNHWKAGDGRTELVPQRAPPGTAEAM